MSYQVEKVNDCTKKLVFNFETLDLTSEVKTALAKKQKSVNLKGFRKGKAPIAMVEQIYGKEAETEALNRFVQNQIYDAITKEDLQVVGYPRFENMKYDAGKSVSFDAVVEFFPEVELKDFSGYEFTKDKAEVSDSDIEDMKKNYLNSKAEMKEVEDEKATLATGQFAVFNFEGEKADGEKPENMKGEDFLLEIGSGQFIPGFEEQMVGLKKGEKKTIEVTFPEDYQAEDLQGAKVKFHIELLEIKEKSYPEFTDELAKEFGFDSVKDFEEKNKKNLQTQRERNATQKLNQAILDKLVEENSFDVPNALVVQQENHVKEDVKRTLSQQGFNEHMMKEYFEKWAGDVTTKAIFQVKSGLILDSLAKKFNVEATEADFDKKLEEIASGSNLDVNQVKDFYKKDKGMKNNLMYAIREEKTFEQITSVVKVTEK